MAVHGGNFHRRDFARTHLHPQCTEMSWTDRILKSINTEEIISQVVDQVMGQLDLEEFVHDLQEKLVATLIERITTELSVAVSKK